MLDRCYLADSVPVLLIWGNRDGVIPVDHGRLAHAAMASSRLSVFEGSGHFPHHSDPERFITELRTFETETAPAIHDRRRWRAKLRSGA